MNGLSREFLKASWTDNIDLIKRYLVVEQTALCPADLILAFGNSTFEPIAHRAADLYWEGLAPKVVVSGGVPTLTGQSEAHAMRDVLMDRGVPASAILVENQATNTQENVVFSRVLTSGLAPGAVIGVGHAVAGRRFLMTMARNWPEVLPMASHVWESGHLSQDWKEDEATINRIRGQFARIAPYIEKGYICEISLPAINAAARKRAREVALDSTARQAL